MDVCETFGAEDEACIAEEERERPARYELFKRRVEHWLEEDGTLDEDDLDELFEGVDEELEEEVIEEKDYSRRVPEEPPRAICLFYDVVPTPAPQSHLELGDDMRWRAGIEYLQKNLALKRCEMLVDLGSRHELVAKRVLADARKHFKRMQNYNRLASQAYFKHFNPNYSTGTPSSLRKLDLHRQYKREAAVLVMDHVGFCQKLHMDFTDVICGKGHHSRGGKAVLRKEILDLLGKETSLKVNVHTENDGRILVSFDY